MSTKAKKAAPKQPAAKRAGRSLEEFRATHDKSYIVPIKVKAALATLGGDWMTEIEFAKHAGVSMVDLNAYRDAFEDFVVVLGGQHKGKRLWAGSKATAAKMREMLR